jgi:hypothetical protein
MNPKPFAVASLSMSGAVLLLTFAGCARAPVRPGGDSSAQSGSPGQASSVAFMDTAEYRRLCQIHPDSSAAGRRECVLRDQNRRLGEKPKP